MFVFLFSNFHISCKEQEFYNQEKINYYIYILSIVLTINNISVPRFLRRGMYPALSPSLFHISDNVKSDHF